MVNDEVIIDYQFKLVQSPNASLIRLECRKPFCNCLSSKEGVLSEFLNSLASFKVLRVRSAGLRDGAY
jgi:hypothetical protein